MRLSNMIGAALLSTLLFAAPVGAQPAPQVDDQMRATARALADEGMSFYEKQKYAEALDRFDRAAAIIQAPTITLHAARSLEKLGKLVESAERYRACINTQLDGTAPEAFRVAQDAARSELQSLTPRIPSILISVDGPGADQAAVMLDGKPVIKALIGVKMLINPGMHNVEATTDTHVAKQDVNVPEKQTTPIVLTLAAKDGDGSGGQTTVPDKPVETSKINGKRVAAFTALGVGGAFTLLGIGAAVAMSSTRSDLDTLCTTPISQDAGGNNIYPVCDAAKPNTDPRFTDLNSTYDSRRYLTITGFVVGGVGLATGAVLLVLSKPKADADAKPASGMTVQPLIGIGSVGLRGTF